MNKNNYLSSHVKRSTFHNRIATGINKGYNIKTITSLKGINSCYNCQENNIMHDEFRDEIYCHDCGTILIQSLTDYQPYPKVEIDNVYDKSHYEAIIVLLKK